MDSNSKYRFFDSLTTAARSGTATGSCRQKVPETVLRVRIHSAPANRHKPSVTFEIAMRFRNRSKSMTSQDGVDSRRIQTIHFVDANTKSDQHAIFHVTC